MKIETLKVENYRGCKAFECAPGDRALVMLAGKNGAGKTSALNAVEWALLGADAGPEEVVRRGAERAEVQLVLDGERRYSVVRRETARGTRTLEVRGPDGGKLDKPQAVLDGLLGARFLDPIAFAKMEPKKQREALLRIVEVPIDLATNAREAEAARDERKAANARLKDAQAEVRNLGPTPADPGPEVDIGELAAEISRRRDAREQAMVAVRDERERQSGRRRDLEASRERGRRLTADLETARGLVVDLERQLAKAREHVTATEAQRAGELETYRHLKAEVEALVEPTVAELPDVGVAEQALREADVHNASIRTTRAAIEKRKEAEARLAQAAERAEVLDQKVKALEQARADAFQQAKMPLPDLAIGEEGLLYRGVPFSQISDGERIRVSLGIAQALSPGLQDIILRDGAFLDEDNLQALAEQAAASGYRLWVERVGTGDAGAIVFVEGAPVQAPEVAHA